jgi:hypothetical protein
VGRGFLRSGHDRLSTRLVETIDADVARVGGAIEDLEVVLGTRQARSVERRLNGHVHGRIGKKSAICCSALGRLLS